jgi:hypothetical protein
MHLGLGCATPPDFVLAAQSHSRVVGGKAYQAVPAFFFVRTPGSGLTIQCLARFPLTSRLTMASKIVGAERVVLLRPCS